MALQKQLVTSGVDMTAFIPQQNGYISRKIGRTTDIEILDKAYKNKQFVLIVGETGTGKTHLVRHFAFTKKLPYARINLNGGTTADELIGHWVPAKDGGFKWQDGILTTFVRNGGVIALDEVNACSPEILFCLHSLTDDEKLLVLQSKDGEIVRANKDFFLVATMNPDYEGTKPLNEAFQDRFKVILDFDYDDDIEKKLIKDEKLRNLAKKLRIMQKVGEISTPISTRSLIAYVENEKIYGDKLAFEFFLNRFKSYEREPIKNVLDLLKGGKTKENEN